MPGLDLADEVGADVGGLGVDTAAELGEERHEARRRSRSRRSGTGACAGCVEAAVEGEDRRHAEQRQGDDQEAGDGAAAQRDLDRLDEAALRGRGGPHVRLAR